MTWHHERVPSEMPDLLEAHRDYKHADEEALLIRFRARARLGLVVTRRFGGLRAAFPVRHPGHDKGVPTVTKIEKLMTAAKLADAANEAIARNRGILARAYNRPRTGVLVPKFTTAQEAGQFDAGWVEADQHFS